MAILNYTTQIDAAKTLGEIQKILAKGGAQKIVLDYDADGNAIAITFSITHNGTPIFFALPCNFTGVLRAMQKSNKIPRSKCTKEQALRVGWRIIKDWIEAQMAIVQAELCETIDVFLPYAVTKSGKTLSEYVKSNDQLLLTQ